MNKLSFEESCRMVEKSLEGLKVDPVKCRGDIRGRWTVVISGGEVWIDIVTSKQDAHTHYFQVMSPLFKLPETNQQGIALDLLDYAHGMYGTSVCKKENWFFVMHLREVEGLDQTELDKAIDRVGFYSNDIYSKFKFKYSAEIA